MRVQLQSVVLVAVGIMAGALAVGVFVLYEGFYSVAATRQHFRPTFWLLKAGLHESVEHHARRIVAPPRIDEPSLRNRGLALYHSQCRQCHGAPGDSSRALRAWDDARADESRGQHAPLHERRALLDREERT
jgi:mono/diheme cytochrome c family protein